MRVFSRASKIARFTRLQGETERQAIKKRHWRGLREREREGELCAYFPISRGSLGIPTSLMLRRVRDTTEDMASGVLQGGTWHINMTTTSWLLSEHAHRERERERESMHSPEEGVGADVQKVKRPAKLHIGGHIFNSCLFACARAYVCVCVRYRFSN